MEKLNLPPYSINAKQQNGRMVILDNQRRKFVTLTPEEWVRQHFTNYLINHLGYPAPLIANEISLQCGNKQLRCDGVLFDSHGNARMLMEYKAPSVNITQKTFNQIAAYNMLLHVDYLIVSNGMKHYCCKINYEDGTYTFLDHIPEYNELSAT